MIDPNKPAIDLGPHAPKECKVCGGPVGFDPGQNLLCCATPECERYGLRILWLNPIQRMDERGNRFEP